MGKSAFWRCGEVILGRKRKQNCRATCHRMSAAVSGVQICFGAREQTCLLGGGEAILGRKREQNFSAVCRWMFRGGVQNAKLFWNNGRKSVLGRVGKPAFRRCGEATLGRKRERNCSAVCRWMFRSGVRGANLFWGERTDLPSGGRGEATLSRKRKQNCSAVCL